MNTAVTAIDSAQSTATISPDVEFEKFRAESNERDLERMRQERGEPAKEKPAATKEKPSTTEPETPAETDDSASSSESAAASEAASTQETRTRTRSSQASENRYAKLSKENRELRERLARLEGAADERDGRRESQPAAERRTETQPAATTAAKTAKPKFDDVDDKGQPKYKTYADYEDARESWIREDLKRELQADGQKTARESQQRQAEETINREWGSRVQKAREKHADYDEVALNPDLPIKQGSAVDVFLLKSKHGTDVLYHLGKHPEELERINQLADNFEKVHELTKIELRFSSPLPARRVTAAPPPVRTVSATSRTAPDEVEQALSDDDVSGYFAAQNARDLAARRGR